MSKTDTPASTAIASGTVPMARINGPGIRRLREGKGVTQLYLATVIGVTTDTISRWEHGRYPSVKLENAERLAQALEVDLAAILEPTEDNASSPPQPQGTENEPTPPPTAEANVDSPHQPTEQVSQPQPSRPTLLPLLLPLLFLASLGMLIRWLATPALPPMTIVAERTLPDHVPPGQTFPVMIRVATVQEAPVSLILKESIPPGSRVISAAPPCTSDGKKSGELKWISRADKQDLTFSYVLQAPAKGSSDAILPFSGKVTLNQGDQTLAEVAGSTSVRLAPFHWADLDKNNKIDDEEILAVYDRFPPSSPLDFDRDVIDAIWSGNGYLWESKTGKYVIQKQQP